MNSLGAVDGELAETKRALLARPGIAAIDLDGTLLGPDLTIGLDNRRAIARLHGAGFEVVLASGRHHESVRPYAQSLSEVRWIVSAQGGEVSDVARVTRLSRDFLASGKVEAVLAMRPATGATTMFYTPDGILTDSGECEDVRVYQALTGMKPRCVELAEAKRASIYKMVWAMSPVAMDSLVASQEVAALGVQTVRSHPGLFEFMPVGVNKASGLATLAARLGLTAEQVVVFGDAENDIPMFDWAACSYAMPHAWTAAKIRATCVVSDGPRETAVARAVDDLLGYPAP